MQNSLAQIEALEKAGSTVLEYKTNGEFIYILYRNPLGALWCGTGILGSNEAKVLTMSFTTPGIARENEQRQIFNSKDL
jgi:hypothetical protein